RDACLTTSIIDEDQSSNTIFPIPAKDFVYIGPNTQWVKLYDYSGKLHLYTSFIKDGRISLGDLRSGTYLLQVFTNESKLITSKILIEE
ncbi:MAG TPA: T9SS type A sorting domain-containing protein, partial [Saprospiraceae bacterium]|nr:T9SS type A sorting domain-containing protein [Saprospiraceae bacterium]